MRPEQATLDLAPIGNCAVSALVDRNGRFVWGCIPRVDGDPTFCSLLSGRDPNEEQCGIWAIDLVDQVKSEQHYERNTPILVTRLTDARGGAIEIVDFCPRYRRFDRMFRPPVFVRIVRPITGAPRIRMRLTPAVDWGAARAERTAGTNHIRFLAAMTLRLSTTAPISHVIHGREWRLESEQFFYLGPDEPFNDDIRDVLRGMYEKTRAYWWRWVRRWRSSRVMWRTVRRWRLCWRGGIWPGWCTRRGCWTTG